MPIRTGPNKVTQPRINAPGFNTKTTGREPGVKPVKSPITKVAFEKTEISRTNVEKVAAEKSEDSCPYEFYQHDPVKEASLTVGDMAFNVGAGAALTVGGVLASELANSAVSAIKSILDKPEFERSYHKALELNPKLRDSPELRHYFKLVAESSPTVAKNPLLVANYMQALVNHDGSANFTAYKNLLELESDIISNRTNSRPLTNIAQKALVEGVVRSAIPTADAVVKTRK